MLNMGLKEKIQHKYALSKQGANDMIKAFVSVTVSNIVLMFPVGVLYFFVKDYLNGVAFQKGMFYLFRFKVSFLLDLNF